MKTLAVTFALPFLICVAGGREWTDTVGRKLEADFVSATADHVTLRRAADGNPITLPLTRLSPADQAYVKGQAAAPAAAAKPIEGPFAALITGDWALSEYKGLPFALYGSKDLSAAQKYPLVVALHGKSQNNVNGQQVGGFMKSFATADNYKSRPCIILVPLCYQPYGGTGGGWSDKPGEQTVDLVKELVKTLPVDKERIYCVGYSMGGFGTCHLIAQEPRLFAAGVAVAGCTGPQTAGVFKKVPLWLFHAVDDATVPVTTSQNLAEELKRAKECRYTEFPTGGHGIAGKVFEDSKLHEWLFSHPRKS